MSLVEEYRRDMARYEKGRATTTHVRPSATAGGSPRRRPQTDAVGAFAYGVADTVTFGFLDEAGAWLDSVILGADYETRLRENREFLASLQKESGAYATGQIAGAFVPSLGWGGRLASAFRAKRLTSGVGGMVAAGAAQGALYGYGSTDSDRLFSSERLGGAVLGGAAGGMGGLVLGTTIIPALRIAGGGVAALVRRGRTPRLAASFKPRPAPQPAGAVAEDLAEARMALSGRIGAKAGNAPEHPQPARWNDLTGSTDDVLEDGALLTTRELLGDPAAARKAVIDRLSKVTPQEAARMVKRLELAELNGDLVNDPHYRSILGIDLSEHGVDVDDISRAAINLEAATDLLMAKAGFGPRTHRQMRKEFAKRYGDAITERDLEVAITRLSQAEHDARLAHHAAAVAGLQYLRVKEKYLPELLKGNREVREKLAEDLSAAIRVFAKARAIKSQLGRGLGILSHKEKLAFAEVKGDVVEIESKEAIKARVNAALNELGDTELVVLFGRLRDLDDVEGLEEVLLNAERAAEFTTWQRLMNSISAFIRSNSFTPGTVVRNTVGMVLHDLFRNRAARAWAARNYEIAGRADEAMKLRFMNQVERSVYWAAAVQGFKALLNRVRWEFWSDVERIAGIANPGGKAALKASASKLAMVQRGYRPRGLSEMAGGGGVESRFTFDPKTFNARNAARRAEGGAFANLVYHLHKAGAATANFVDALGTAVGRFTTGALDDFGREFVMVKEAYALSARQAMEEGLNQGLPPDALQEYATRRAAELAEFPPSEILQRVEQRLLNREKLTDEEAFLVARDQRTEKEALRTLFLDRPQTAPGQAFYRAAYWLDRGVGFGQVSGILMTYIRTPTRIFERGFVHYTPWAHKAREVKEALAKGGVEAEIVRAQAELGGLLIGIGAMAAFAGIIRLTNGGYDNSANLLGAPPNRVQIGDAYFELQGLDPFALTLAMGGFIGQAMRAYQDTKEGYGTEEALHTALDIAFLAVRDAILEKTYMTSLRDLLKSVLAEDGGGFAAGAQKIFASAFTRAIPLSGWTRTINDTIRADAPEAISLMDQLFRVAPGLGLRLPPRVNALGDPVEGRDFGLTFGSTGDVDDVTRQLAELEIDITNVNRADPAEFALTAEELSELRMIRGREALNSDGMTMKEALADLFADPWFRALPTREAKRKAVMEVMSDFNEEARAILEERNPRYAANREGNRALREYLFGGLTQEEARRRAAEDVVAVGLPEPDRLN